MIDFYWGSFESRKQLTSGPVLFQFHPLHVFLIADIKVVLFTYGCFLSILQLQDLVRLPKGSCPDYPSKTAHFYHGLGVGKTVCGRGPGQEVFQVLVTMKGPYLIGLVCRAETSGPKK